MSLPLKYNALLKIKNPHERAAALTLGITVLDLLLSRKYGSTGSNNKIRLCNLTINYIFELCINN